MIWPRPMLSELACRQQFSETFEAHPEYTLRKEVTIAVDDARLVERCLRGESAGVREFLEQFQGPVFGLCLRLLGHREDAEDVTQETLARAVKHLARWDPARALKPWVLTIAANRCRTWAGKRRRSAATMEAPESIASPRQRQSVIDLGEELQLALNELRDEYRTSFVLFHQEELSCQQIGEMLDCPEGTVKTWLHRARKELAETLKRRGVVTGEGYELHRF